MTEAKFFVYGSMSEGLVHFNRIRDFVVSTESATAKGTAYRLKVGYPVLLEEGSDAVPGCLVTLKASEILISLLDQFHGYSSADDSKCLYFRKEIQVLKIDGSTELVWVYVLNPAKLPKNAVHIEGGDWRSLLAQQPALTDQLTERQRTYIQKLGASTGREIVPIDLGLYRELMKLELIVDKGRRLALSKLGSEVYRYLS